MANPCSLKMGTQSVSPVHQASFFSTDFSKAQVGCFFKLTSRFNANEQSVNHKSLHFFKGQNVSNKWWKIIFRLMFHTVFPLPCVFQMVKVTHFSGMSEVRSISNRENPIVKKNMTDPHHLKWCYQTTGKPSCHQMYEFNKDVWRCT